MPSHNALHATHITQRKLKRTNSTRKHNTNWTLLDAHHDIRMTASRRTTKLQAARRLDASALARVNPNAGLQPYRVGRSCTGLLPMTGVAPRPWGQRRVRQQHPIQLETQPNAHFADAKSSEKGRWPFSDRATRPHTQPRRSNLHSAPWLSCATPEGL